MEWRKVTSVEKKKKKVVVIVAYGTQRLHTHQGMVNEKKNFPVPAVKQDSP